jgi:hypothetical protein
MPIVIEAKVLLAWLVVSIIVGFGWHVGNWIGSKILR